MQEDAETVRFINIETVHRTMSNSGPSILDSIALAVEPREFRIRTGRRIRAGSYATEAEAADAAEERGLSAFDVVEVQHAAAYTVTHVPTFTPTSPPASKRPDACNA